MRSLDLTIRRIAASDATVLIRGEPGTEKELVAAAIHSSSRRSRGPLMKLHCAAVSESLLEGKLFGYADGSPPQAVHGRPGCVQQAEGGTLFLDEIGVLPVSTQVKLLRVLQERQYEPLGSANLFHADVRLVASTSQNLEAAAEEGRFREDLYYRISVIPIDLPPLRQRRSDILPLVAHFIAEYSPKLGKHVVLISPSAIDLLWAYGWPGNVHELESCVERAVLLAADGVIRAQDLPSSLGVPESVMPAEAASLDPTVTQTQRDMITVALKQARGNLKAAAELLLMTPQSLRRRIKNLGIDPKSASESPRTPTV